MDKKYLENNKLIEKIKITRSSTIYWYAEENEQYRVRVMVYNREVYNKVLDKKHYKIYRHFINERVNYLIEGDILYKDYNMILIDNTMYQVIDLTSHFKEMLRMLIPVEGEYYYNVSENIFDLVLDCTLRTGEVFDDQDLVFHNGVFYSSGNVICSIRDFERDGIDYEVHDLIYGFNQEQLDYLNMKVIEVLGFNKISRYISHEIIINIDRCY
jgi:hypothetical protein